MNRETVQNEFINTILDNMTYEDLYQIAYDNLHSVYSEYTNEQLIGEITQHYPDILDDTNETDE